MGEKRRMLRGKKRYEEMNESYRDQDQPIRVRSELMCATWWRPCHS